MAIYLKYAALKGSVTTKGYEGWIDIDSFQWGVSRHVANAARSGGNREAAEPVISEIHLSKRMDDASVPLIQEAWGGVSSNKATLKFTTTSKNGVVDYLNYDLTDCVISNYSMSAAGAGGGGGGDLMPNESISLNFAKITVKYVSLDAKLSAKPFNASYNLMEQKGS